MRKLCCFCLPSFTSRFEHDSSSCEQRDASLYLLELLAGVDSSVPYILANSPFVWERWNPTIVFVCVSLRATEVGCFLHRFSQQTLLLRTIYFVCDLFSVAVVLRSRYESQVKSYASCSLFKPHIRTRRPVDHFAPLQNVSAKLKQT